MRFGSTDLQDASKFLQRCRAIGFTDVESLAIVAGVCHGITLPTTQSPWKNYDPFEEAFKAARAWKNAKEK
jgi:hypothetical protein